MAQITDYTTLIAEVKVWLKDSNLTDDTVEGWIQLAESSFRRVLATLDNEATVDFVPSDEFETLPADFNGLREAFIDGSPPKPLVLITPAQMTSYGVLTGFPTYISIQSGKFKFSPSAETETVTITYFQKLVALSDGSPTNYLILDYPDVYLSATLAVAQKDKRDDEDASQHIAIVDGWIADMKAQDMRRKYSGQQKRVGVNPVVSNIR